MANGEVEREPGVWEPVELVEEEQAALGLLTDDPSRLRPAIRGFDAARVPLDCGRSG